MLSKNLRSTTTRRFHPSPSALAHASPHSMIIHTPSRDSSNKRPDPRPPNNHHAAPPETAQGPHEPDSGGESKGEDAGIAAGIAAGAGNAERRTSTTWAREHGIGSRTEPYAVPAQDRRYGGVEMYMRDKGPEMSRPCEGPAGGASGGRKPEGR